MEFNIAKKIDNLIIDNQDEILMHLEEKIELIRENSMDFKLNPLKLLESFGIEFKKCDNLDNRYKTYFGCKDNMEPCICYNSKLELKELRFYIMSEIIYYFMFKYIIENYLDEKDYIHLENRVFHVTEFDNIEELLNSNSFINKTIRDKAFDAMVPSNIFIEFEHKKLGLKQLSTYFETDERIIDFYLKEIKKKKNKSKIRILFNK